VTLLGEPAAPVPECEKEGTAQTTMTVLGHIGELRRRLLICGLAIAVGTTVGWVFYDHLVGFMVTPYRDFLIQHPRQNVSGGNLVAIAPLEGFTTRLKVCGYAGVGLASPVWLWQLWRFIAPALYKIERRYAASFLSAALSLFVLGVTTAILVFPKAISWMIRVGGIDVAPLFSPSRYLGMYALCCLIFGLAFIYPVVLVFLELIRALSSAQLRRWRRYAIVGIVALAALITPSSDPFYFLAMAIPLLVFYEASIVVGRILHR
jgi:sec-independent protein translocase protein TatC